MRILLSLLSLLLALPAAIGGETSRNKEEESEQAAEDPSCIHHSYISAVSAARNSGKDTVIVLFSEDKSGKYFSQLVDLAKTMEKTVLSQYAEFSVISYTGISLLIYPPLPDPMSEEVAKFKHAFPELTSSSDDNAYMVTLSVSPHNVQVMDTVPLDLEHKNFS
ncbi:hypothetical protein CP10139811_0542 [Chlamydia ibidis]|uniref:Uncharacterized protein n=2 Tax=Chlamydia ibidis TaxID=1405396 RepID=S7J2Z3_9CHLA|nr:hypothetical protein [Chlamydia ibidis]EPP34759.1 hypothetical protein CP10139811_0542 [Chlamydia ibidis]EQM62431.1 hypothetical protein H359_0922 [Chlamydia ibidis 10-1398/6]